MAKSQGNDTPKSIKKVVVKPIAAQSDKEAIKAMIRANPEMAAALFGDGDFVALAKSHGLGAKPSKFNNLGALDTPLVIDVYSRDAFKQIIVSFQRVTLRALKEDLAAYIKSGKKTIGTRGATTLAVLEQILLRQDAADYYSLRKFSLPDDALAYAANIATPELLRRTGVSSTYQIVAVDGNTDFEISVRTEQGEGRHADKILSEARETMKAKKPSFPS